MKNNIKIIFFIFIVLVMPSMAFSAVSEIGLDGLDQTGGARPLGMGGAYTAVTDDINCLFYNPASIAFTRGLTASIKDAKNFALGAGYQTRAGNFGLGIVYKNYEGFETEAIKSSYEHSIAFLSYGNRIDQIAFGVSLKTLFSQRLSVTGNPALVSTNGYDADAGILWQPVNFASIGLVLHNISEGKYTLGTTNETFPRSTRGGISLNLLETDSVFYNDFYGIKLSFDSESKNAGNIAIQNSFYGIEFSYGGWLYLRLGAASIYTIDRTASLTSFGLGYKFGYGQIDFSSHMDPFTESQISYLSLDYTPPALFFFPPSPEEKEYYIEEQQAAPEATPPKEEIKELLKVIFPNDDHSTYDEVIAVSGEVRQGATAFINGVEVYISNGGRFSALQPLNPGKNLIEIEARLKDEKKVMSRKVLRKAKVLIAEEEGLNKKIVDEVLNKEAELVKRTEELSKKKAEGLDVSLEEQKLQEERSKYEVKKTSLYAEKNKLEERKEKVENLATLGVIEVSPDKKFEIEAPITRGEILTWLVKAAALPVPKVSEAVFSDVPANHKYAPYIKAAVDLKLVIVSGDKFRPDEPVTEQEGQEFFRAFGVIQ